jgi:hypothetical protein
VEGSCEHGIEPSGSINAGKHLRGCTIDSSVSVSETRIVACARLQHSSRFERYLFTMYSSVGLSLALSFRSSGERVATKDVLRWTGLGVCTRQRDLSVVFILAVVVLFQ